MNNTSIEFLGGPLWLIILTCLIVFGLIYLYYRRTTPPIGRPLKIVLICLRIIVLGALFLALAQPILTWTKRDSVPKKMAILVDSSNSMKLPLAPGSSTTRADAVRDLLSGGDFSTLTGRLDVTYYNFAESLVVRDNASALTGTSTDPGLAVSQLVSATALNPDDYIMIISDGRATEGENLADLYSRHRRPVYTIAVGDSSRVNDIALSAVDYNDVIYAGRKTEMTATVSQMGEIDGRVNISLYNGSTLLAQKTAQPPGEGKTADYTLEFTPTVPGRLILDMRVATSDQESNEGNNRKKFSVRVLKSKLRILIYSSSLNQEYAFLNRYLTGREDYDVERVIDAPGGDRLGIRFPTTQEALNSYDAIILIDPDLGRLSSHYDRLVSFLNDRSGGLWVLMGEKYMQSHSGSRLETLMPLAVASPSRLPIMFGKFHLVPDQRMVFHPAVKLGESREQIAATWSNQPPFLMALPVDSVRSAGVALAYLEGESQRNRQCGMALRRMGGGKILNTATAPLWHWAFFPVGIGSDSKNYDDLVASTLRWLTIGDESDRVIVKPDRDIFQNGEPVTFSGTAHDAGFRPLDNAEGDLTIISQTGDSTLARILPVAGKPGQYRADVGMLPPGTYTWRGILSAENLRLGRFDGTFAVDDIDREMAFGDVDWNYLARASENSGGMFVSYKNIAPLLDAIDTEHTTIEESGETRLWDNLILLLIMIGGLSVEWFIRKQRQLL